MYVQPYYRETPDELRHVVPASRAAEQLVSSTATPFRPLSLRDRLRQAVAKKTIQVTEWLLGCPLYTENTYREINALEPRSRAFLMHLMRSGVISKWMRQPMTPEITPIEMVMLDIAPTKLPSGREIYMGGSTGNGTGYTLNEAIIPAFGELLERYSLTCWNEHSLVMGSFNELKSKGATNPNIFQFYSDQQLKQPEFQKSLVDDNTQLQWIKAKDISQGEVLIPASLIHIFYQEAFPEDPVFWATTSNAAGAGTSYEHAAYGAICEAIERDGLMIFWLNRLSPPRLDVATCGVHKLVTAQAECERLGIRFEVLNCTTELGVPTFISLTIDSKSEHPVFMSAVADLSVEDALNKLARETLKGLHANWRPKTRNVQANEIQIITDRLQYWSDPALIAEVEFLLQGPKQTVDNVVSYDLPNFVAKLEKLRGICKEHNLSWYIADITSRVAKQAGLCVVKAIIPEIVPIHFPEKRKHLGVKRLYSVPRVLGYTKNDTTEADINPVPHPFL